ncbi:hemerythrin domain-containing protein [Janthinobacterium sp. LB3P118]|uniref:hemerythrin domain-containing protein n=1 Tax=Janthinobacterium sp. LB3P118 TaxID=3424195 RepID=UPI003F2930DF
MNIDKFKQQHLAILASIDDLRQLARGGVAAQAQACGVAKVAQLGRQYENDMHGIAGACLDFAGRWNTPVRLAAEPDAFRSEANTVLHALTQRMRREDHELYPAVETLA